MRVANHEKFVGIDESRARTEDDGGCPCGCRAGCGCSETGSSCAPGLVEIKITFPCQLCYI
jgi:hypothetical protein